VPEFDDVRVRLRDARDAIAAADRALFAVRERLRRLDAREAELARVLGPNADDQRFREERERLARDKAAAHAEQERERHKRAELTRVEADLLTTFSEFSDPRRAIARFDDRTPILLMPLRLETRFKRVSDTATELWVRVYPDDCWIDSFDPALTETEVRNTRAYWINVWQAGGIEAQERAAWRALVSSHGSGRASWLVEQYQPANVTPKPTKPRAEDIILTVPTDAALTAAEASAAATFWRAVWLADGDAAATGTARAALEAAVGAARANEIVTDYQPVNLGARPASGVAKTQLNVSVAFVVFSAADLQTKPQAWARPPKLTILPDRFVFIGYHGSDPPVIALGSPVPATLMVGPDPAADATSQLKHDAQGNLVIPDELLWLSNFERAERDGMALRVPLTAAQARHGFDRVLVLGLRVNADTRAAQHEFEALLSHHAHSRTGLSVVPQGTPTNNTEAAASGYGRQDDPDQSFDDRKTPRFVASPDWLDKRDGQWLAEYLGVDPSLFQHVHHADMTDQLAARAMNTALWPATLGYWMETMMAPVFTTDAIDRTRRFFTQYVLGAGAVPAIRIGSQPYGILPATAFSRMTWLSQPAGVDERGAPADVELLPMLRRLHPILLGIDRDWRALVPSSSIAHVGAGASTDPHATLLDIIGLHPGSVEWSQRYAESLESLFNRLNLQGFGGLIQSILLAAERERARQTLTTLGYAGSETPPLLDQVFSSAHLLLNGGVVDDAPLSETAPIRAYTTSKQNYLQWLIDAGRTSLDALYTQQGFLDDTPPVALLYLMLRHALQLGYHDVGIKLHADAGLYTAAQVLAARREAAFIHVRDTALASESRYQPLYVVQPAITGSATQMVGSFIASRLETTAAASNLRDQLAALERLKALPTARLERAFADHVDTCAYRLDAWWQGLVTYQLALMRNIVDQRDVPSRPGLYLGAYAWLEALRPEEKTLTPVVLDDPELVRDFSGVDEPPLVRDSTNQGYVHAPSLNHAVAAAILRNGFISNASEQNRRTLAVNLTSERVRTALALLEGIRGGQSLSDLLGYQFERGLHDRHGLAEVDKFIYKLRKAFPLRGDRMQSTKTEEGVSIESIEARNVIDGLALVEHLRATNNTAYPFGKTGLPAATADEAEAIDAEASRLLESHDAVADLALAEGVYQAVLGNYDRVASTYDAYARGHFPPEPDVVRTPLNGIGLTMRVALHLDADADATVSPIAGLPMTPRAQGEPSINAWLAAMLPPLDQIACVVSFRDAATGDTSSREVTLRQLDLQPADVIAIIRDDTRQAMTELDDRAVRFAVTHFGPRPDVPVSIAYMSKVTARFSVFEVLPLIRSLRRLVTTSRPLTATDLALASEAQTQQDTAPFVDTQRLVLVRTALGTLRTDLAAFAAQLQGPLADLANRRGEILEDVDDHVATLSTLLARAAAFGIPQSGWGFAYDARRRIFEDILREVADLATRWNARLSEFDALVTVHDDLPAMASDEERFRVLIQAERALSTVPMPPPATPALFRAVLLGVTRPAFVAKRQQFVDVANTTRTGLAALRSDVLALLPIADFDVTPFSLASQDNDIVRFAEDALLVINAVIGHVDRRLQESATELQAADDAAAAIERVAALVRAAQSLLGEDFRIVPEFTLEAARADEIANALAISRSVGPFQHLTHPADPDQALDFPIDTWLHGVARVRDKMHAWEQVVLMTAALGQTEPSLDALQFPVIPGDAWVGLELASGQTLERDRLLYTAHFAALFDKTAPQRGLLLDEWTETIPGTTAHTGIAFHDDRPNSEAPQAMLLVTPSAFRGAWQWDDLVDALNETFDLAQRRAIEPKHGDAMPYAPFLPATIMASQARQLTIAANLALNNRVVLASQEG
jgi:hypothetical protein